MDIFDPGNPNQEAEGIVNDAFDEMDQAGKASAAAAASSKPEKEPEEADILRKDSLTAASSQRKSSLDVSEVDAKNIQPNDLRDLVAPNMAADNSSSVDREEEEPVGLTQKKSSIIEESEAGGEDPFDTSAFDADAFDAFESRFESTELGKAAIKSADPFASPYKSAKGPSSEDSKNAFDSFAEPFVPKQPENTPFHQATKATKPAKAPKVKKDSFEDSFDSDGDEDSEAEENIKIVIRAKMKDSADADGNEPPAIGKSWLCIHKLFPF